MPALRDREHETLDLLRTALAEQRFGRIATVSSFGAESAVLLHLIARVDRATPVIFIDTRMLFAETLDHKIAVTRHLGLSDVRTVSPDGQVIRAKDAWGRLHLTDPDACCDFRKTQVLDAALAGFDGWITGRKRFQALTRSDLDLVERAADGRTKLNPLAFWTADDIADYADLHDLPQHPLAAHGYASIGCAACTSPVGDGEDARAGRWRGMGKVECGIHFENGRIVRRPAAHV